MAVLNRTAVRAQPKSTTALRLAPVLLAAGGAIVVIALLQVVQTSQATTTSFAIQRLERQRLEVEANVRQLEAEVSALSSLPRIQWEAKRLGLQPPRERTSVEVNVAWPAADRGRLPSRFAPVEDEEAQVDGQGSSWWRDLLQLLPFY